MYKPKFNKALVEIDDKDAVWGKSSDGNMAGEVYREGKVLEIGDCHAVPDHPEFNPLDALENMTGKQIMWNEGHEAGTVFEENGKKYCLIYWWDIIGVKDEV